MRTDRRILDPTPEMIESIYSLYSDPLAQENEIATEFCLKSKLT
jgi:hypothetical protein